MNLCTSRLTSQHIPPGVKIPVSFGHFTTSTIRIGVQPESGELALAGSPQDGDLTLMVRENEVFAARVNVNHFRLQQFNG